MIGAGILALTSISSLSAEKDQQKEGEEEPIKGAFPSLDILPEGSILRRVRLPRYNKDFIPTSLLTADTMTVLDKQRIEGVGITINLYAEDRSLNARTKMRHAIYNQKNSTLHANEAIFIEGKGYRASGIGMIFDWKNNRGLLLGPVNTEFKRTLPPKTTSMKLQPSPAPRHAIAGSLMILTSLSTSTMAEPPAKLTPAQLEEFDRLAQPVSESIALEQEETRATLKADEQRNQKAIASMAPFLKSVDQGGLLISTTDTKPAAEAPKPEPKKTTTPKKKEPVVQTLKVTCDGGLYFDTDTGILAYLKNINLTEARFNLTCTDELKIFLEKKPEPKKEPKKKDDQKTDKTAEAPTQKEAVKKDTSKKEKKKDDLAKFGDLERIIATGKVKLTRKDEEGRTFIATAESASYNAKTGEMILKGGKPRLQLGPNQFLQSLAPGQWIRILRNGKFITEGKWTMVTPVPQR